jgi:Lon-like protease
MTISQLDAKKAALSLLGYRAPPAAGAFVTAVLPSKPAGRLLRTGDLVLAADGHAVRQPDDLARIVRSHRPGTKVRLRIVRDGRQMTVAVGVAAHKGGGVIGVLSTTTYRFPVSISIDTSDISGPSGGLAMTLAIIDDLTPGDLTGGKRVAVTGTIAPDGSVGQIGAIAQKAVSARAAHAQLFIVPSCGPAVGRQSKGYAPYAACLHDLAVARDRAGKHVEVVPVSTLRQALAALRRAGGAPLPPRRAG